MLLHDLSVFSILLLEILKKGSAESLNFGGHWLKQVGGVCPTTPPENGELMLNQCMIRCFQRDTCKEIYYTWDTRQCRLQDSTKYYQLPDSPTTEHFVFYEPEKVIPIEKINLSLPEVQTVILEDNDVLTLRVFPDAPLEYSACELQCYNLGGHLIHAFTPTRHALFKVLLDDMAATGSAWIDLTNRKAADFYDINEWTTKADQVIPSSGTFWKDNQPVKPDKRHCVAMLPEANNKWKAVICYSKNTCICEL